MKKVIVKPDENKKISSISFDVHYYRRVFHTFGAFFLLYYMLPDIDWINISKLSFLVLIIISASIIEICRLKGLISNDYIFGLRDYEKKRVGSYWFFVLAIFILLLFFPQQIAIPCILCGCIADPVIGEIRLRFGKNWVYLIGFLLCMVFFMVSWYKSDLWLLILVAIIGSCGAILGEVKKFAWLDDDFMIQFIPAVFLIILVFIITNVGIDFSFEQVIYPGEFPW